MQLLNMGPIWALEGPDGGARSLGRRCLRWFRLFGLGVEGSDSGFTDSRFMVQGLEHGFRQMLGQRGGGGGRWLGA